MLAKISSASPTLATFRQLSRKKRAMLRKTKAIGNITALVK